MMINMILETFNISNILVRNIVFSLLSGVIIYLTNYIKNNYHLWFNKLYKQSTEIYLNKYSDDYLNIYYDILSWYMTQYKFQYGAFDYNKSYMKIRTCLHSHVPQIIDFKTYKIEITYFHTKVDKSNIYYAKLRLLNLENIEILKDFLEYISNEYEQFNKTMMWQQKYTEPKITEGRITCILYPTKSQRTFDNVFLDKDDYNLLIKDIETFQESKDIYKNLGIAWKRGYLLSGEPGCGKTSVIQAISNKLQYNIFNINLSNIYSDEQMNKIFRDIPSRSLILFEDIDCQSDIVLKRQFQDEPFDKSEQDEPFELLDKQKKKPKCSITLSNLLNKLDGIINLHEQVIIMTTNHIDKLDPALIRPGRIDVRIQLKYCSRHQIKKLIKLYHNHDISENILVNFKEYQHKPSYITSRLMINSLDETIQEFFS
jgi:hypothetical protein